MNIFDFPGETDLDLSKEDKTDFKTFHISPNDNFLNVKIEAEHFINDLAFTSLLACYGNLEYSGNLEKSLAFKEENWPMLSSSFFSGMRGDVYQTEDGLTCLKNVQFQSMYYNPALTLIERTLRILEQ